MNCLGGRLSDSGSRPGQACDGANATRVIDRGKETETTRLGRPAAQQAAQADEQQPPAQLRSESRGSVPACFHCVCCNDAGIAGRSDGWVAVDAAPCAS